MERNDALKRMARIVEVLKELDAEYNLKHTDFQAYSALYARLIVE